MSTLKFNECNYSCDGKRDKRGSFRVYCRRIDPKCKQITPALSTSPPLSPLFSPAEKYVPIIQQVIGTYPKQRIHGTQFFIVDGKAIADRIPTIRELKKHQEIISVHSHSAMNWEKHGKEEFSPFSDGDVDNLRKGLKEGWLTGMIVITADGRMDYLGVSPSATREQIVERAVAQGFTASPKILPRLLAFLKMGPKSIGKDLNISVSERISTGDYPFARKRLRVFASKYGLNFREGLHWL